MPDYFFNILFSIIFFCVFVLPPTYHLLSDLRQKKASHFSLIPHKPFHWALIVFRLGLIIVTANLERSMDDHFYIWGILGIFFLIVVALISTDRRLTINAETGLIRWRKISLPWWPSNTAMAHQVGKVRRSGEQTHDLLGVGKLREKRKKMHNGKYSTSGHYSRETLDWIFEQANEYLRAFKKAQ